MEKTSLRRNSSEYIPPNKSLNEILIVLIFDFSPRRNDSTVFKEQIICRRVALRPAYEYYDQEEHHQ